MTYLRRSRKPYQPPKKHKPLERVGKATGTVRLYGSKRDKLRDDCHQAANGFCQLMLHPSCKGQYVPLKDGHMAHVKGVGAGGPDELKNTKWSCGLCHHIWHQYGPEGQKPVPPKPALHSNGEHDGQ